jgi:hypothetical protein
MDENTRTGAEELRLTAKWCDHQREGFNDRFSAEELVKLWRHTCATDFEHGEFADDWPEEEIARALAPGNCAHPGAKGPCIPRVRDGRCVWCEREMPVMLCRECGAPGGHLHGCSVGDAILARVKR